MQVHIAITFENETEYSAWMERQIIAASSPAVALGEEQGLAEDLGVETPQTVPPSEHGPAVVPGPPAAKKPKRRSRKGTAAKKSSKKPAKKSEPEAAPVEAQPAAGETVLTLEHSRNILTAYLATEGNGADTLLKELGKHNAKRINELPQDQVHGFLKRMVAASSAEALEAAGVA